ncbi:hypothetical protein HanIR_Chr09g0420121 [Helianthus annuus]|nr:hypothetical protein HanIR_Chr09g0420121 [Helianthus annuus]
MTTISSLCKHFLKELDFNLMELNQQGFGPCCSPDDRFTHTHTHYVCVVF